jgi:hypothetical protein
MTNNNLYQGLDQHDFSDFVTLDVYNDPQKRAMLEDRARRAFADHGRDHVARGEPDEQILPDSVSIDWIERPEYGCMQIFATGYCSCASLSKKAAV